MGSAELKKDQIENGTLLKNISQISKRIPFGRELVPNSVFKDHDISVFRRGSKHNLFLKKYLKIISVFPKLPNSCLLIRNFIELI